VNQPNLGAGLPPDRGGRRRRGALDRTALFSISLAVLLGLLFGVGLFTFGYGKGYSYLMSNPKTCTNCHVMQGNYDSWEQSSHRHVAKCNDCHLPHDLVGHWLTEADNGFNHSLAFTLENFHEPIRIKPRNRRVTQGACLHCHETTVHETMPTTPGGEAPLCVHCHKDVGHALRN
jgi:cytochrome c nitrite reductase small subunit